MKQNPIICACELCGKPQQKDKLRSNENWNVYDTKAVCECGGKFKIMLREDAEKLRK